MRKLLGVLAAMVMLFISATAYGHVGNIIAFTSYTAPDTVTVRLTDLYETPFESMQVTATVGHAGHGQVGEPITFAETAPGTYVGKLGPHATGTFELTVNAVVAAELFKGVLQLQQGVDQPEVSIYLMEIEENQAPFAPWQIALFGGALVGVGCVTWVAMKRLSQPQS